MKVTAALASAKTPTSSLTIQERRVVTSLGRDPNINILPADKGRCTVILNTDDYKVKVDDFLKDTATYEILKRDPTSSYKKKIIETSSKKNKVQLPLEKAPLGQS